MHANEALECPDGCSCSQKVSVCVLLCDVHVCVCAYCMHARMLGVATRMNALKRDPKLADKATLSSPAVLKMPV